MRVFDIVAGSRPPASARKPAELSERVAHAREVVAQTDAILDDLAAYAERVKQRSKK